jgi:hypothetical protein
MAHKLTQAAPAANFLGGILKRTAALFLLIPLLLAGCAQSPGSGGGGLVDTKPFFSTLDGSGMDQIKATKTAVLDMRSGKLTRGAAGLDSTAKSASIDAPEGLDLKIVGPKGVVEAKTKSLSFSVSDGSPDITEVNYAITADSNEAYFAMLNDDIKKYRIPEYATSRWIEAITKVPDFSETNDLGTGRAAGVEVQYLAEYNASDGTRAVQVSVTPEPLYAPASVAPLGTMDWEKDPMSQYVETITTPEEKVARLRAYTALPEILNAASPVHETPTSVYEELFEKDIITADYRVLFKEQTEWGTGQYPARNAGYTYQVTAMYCPMHEQTLTVLDRGYLSCAFTGQYMRDGQPVSKSEAERVTWVKTADDDETQYAKVSMKMDGGIWKVDRIEVR